MSMSLVELEIFESATMCFTKPWESVTWISTCEGNGPMRYSLVSQSPQMYAFECCQVPCLTPFLVRSGQPNVKSSGSSYIKPVIYRIPPPFSVCLVSSQFTRSGCIKCQSEHWVVAPVLNLTFIPRPVVSQAVDNSSIPVYTPHVPTVCTLANVLMKSRWTDSRVCKNSKKKASLELVWRLLWLILVRSTENIGLSLRKWDSGVDYNHVVLGPQGFGPGHKVSDSLIGLNSIDTCVGYRWLR